MFLDRFKELCSKKGVSAYRACTDIGLNRSSVAKWKNGSIPNGSTLNRLADYFGVSVDYLLGNERTHPKDELTEKDRRDIARDLEALMADLENSGDLMFDGDPASPKRWTAFVMRWRWRWNMPKRSIRKSTPEKV